MDRKLKTGVIGAGVFGAFHAGKHAQSLRSSLTGIFDIDADRAGALADRFGARRFSSLDALLASVDAVTIATTAPSHFEIAKQALVAGRHVYVEKPLAMTVEEADILIALAESQSLVLQVGHQERFVLAAMGAPHQDAAPRRLQFSRCGPPSGRGEDVSVVFDLMIHDLDIARLFGFSAPVKVAACGDRHETIATLTFAEGRQCSFIASRRMDARRRVLKADYEDGSIEIDFVNRTYANSASAVVSPEFANLSAFSDPLGASVDAFFASVLDGAATMVDGKAGRGAIEWARLIEEARENLNAASPAFDRMIA